MQISDFNEVIGSDFARNNLYSIEIYMPRGHKGMGASDSGEYLGKFYTGADEEKGGSRFLSYKAKQVSIPGKSLGTMDAKRFGPIFKVANDLIIDTTTMTFMCGEDYAEHRFFDGWISAVMGQVKHGTGVSKRSPKPNHRQVYTLSYYNDYIGEVRIIPLDRQGGAIANVVLIEAYPSNVGPIEYIWGETGEIATFTVTWTYRDWNHTDPEHGWWADSNQIAQGSVMGAPKRKEKTEGESEYGTPNVKEKTEGESEYGTPNTKDPTTDTSIYGVPNVKPKAGGSSSFGVPNTKDPTTDTSIYGIANVKPKNGPGAGFGTPNRKS